MAMISNPEVRRIVEWAEKHGFAYKGMDGRGHHVLRYKTGENIRLPATPSEYRSLRNSKADIRRLCGESPDGLSKAGHYRHEGQREGFDMDAALKARDARKEAILDAEIDAIVENAMARLEIRLKLASARDAREKILGELIALGMEGVRRHQDRVFELSHQVANLDAGIKKLERAYERYR